MLLIGDERVARFDIVRREENDGCETWIRKELSAFWLENTNKCKKV